MEAQMSATFRKDDHFPANLKSVSLGFQYSYICHNEKNPSQENKRSFKLEPSKLGKLVSKSVIDEQIGSGFRQWKLTTVTYNHLLYRTISSVSLLRFNKLNNIHAFQHLPEYNMPPIQPWCLQFPEV